MSNTDFANVINAFSLISSAVSLVLAVVAIWLSWVFYKMAAAESSELRQTAKKIEGDVDKLQALFETMYTGVFSVMRDTVADMRSHAWPHPRLPGPGQIPDATSTGDPQHPIANVCISDYQRMLLRRVEDGPLPVSVALGLAADAATFERTIQHLYRSGDIVWEGAPELPRSRHTLLFRRGEPSSRVDDQRTGH